jgi:acetyltransferase-like isoleucine patch superfamily enzyme
VLAMARELTTRVAALTIRSRLAIRGVRLDIDAAAGARLSGRVRVMAGPRGTARLQMSAGAVVEDGATLCIGAGADIFLGPGTVVRHGSILNVTGRLELLGDNLISWYSVVHCQELVRFELKAGTGEQVTVVDGDHYRTSTDDHWYHNSRGAAVIIGANTWLAAKTTVLRGVTIGPGCTVAAGSVVQRSYPEADQLLGGAPARVLKQQINQPGNS